MSSPRNLGLAHWNEMVGTFHDESDRGAAILAGSFAEHALGIYLKFRIRDKKVAEALFAPMGPLSSFAQRIAIAYAFDLVSATEHSDFEGVRHIRNHFAHHPLDTTFATPEIGRRTAKLSTFGAAIEDQYSEPAKRHRIAYLLTCGVLCAKLLGTMEGQGEIGPGGASAEEGE